MGNKKRNPWDRWIDKLEGPGAYDLFLIFLSFGVGRTPAQVVEKSGRKLSTVNKLRGKYQWVRRARAYDDYLNQIQRTAIENRRRDDAIVMAERDSAYRFEAYDFSEELLAKARQMLATPLYTEEVIETRDIQVGEVLVTGVPVKITRKPAKWTFKDMVTIAEFSDKLRRLAMGVPTSRTAIEVSPSLTLEERVSQAKAAMKFWRENKLERAIHRILGENPSAEYSEVREGLLAEAPVWFAEDHKVPDPSLLLTEGSDPPPLPLGGSIEETESSNN